MASDYATSRDGTKIAFEKFGEGPAVIIVAGALNTRAFDPQPELVKLLKPHLSVYFYDRRGRNDSGDTKPYAVQREVEDIEALIDEAGEAACLFGHSSGACLALEASIALGAQVKKLAMYEPPYNSSVSDEPVWGEYYRQLSQLVAGGPPRRGSRTIHEIRGFARSARWIDATRLY